METRPHPFAAKLTPDQAADVRRLRAGGVPLAQLAAKFGISEAAHAESPS